MRFCLTCSPQFHFSFIITYNSNAIHSHIDHILALLLPLIKELGHNFDADHTHEDYGGGRVDNCGVDSDPNQGGLQPTCTGVSAGSGSIMSYCHLCVGSKCLYALRFVLDLHFLSN